MNYISVFIYFNLYFLVFQAGSHVLETPTSPMMFPRIWGVLPYIPQMCFLSPASWKLGGTLIFTLIVPISPFGGLLGLLLLHAHS